MDAWTRASQRILDLELALLRHRLNLSGHPTPKADDEANQRAGRDAAIDVAEVEAERTRLTSELTRPPPLEFLEEAFSLTPFERLVVLLACAPHFDAAFSEYFCDLGEKPRGLPTPAIAWRTFAPTPELRTSASSAFLATSPLRHHRLVDLGEHVSQALRPLVVDERLVAFVQGLVTHDERIEYFCDPIRSATLADTQEKAARELGSLLTTLRKGKARPIFNLVGRGGQRRIAKAALSSLTARLVELHPARLPTTEDLDPTLRLLAREATLSRCAYFLDGTATNVGPICERLDTVVIVATEEPLVLDREVIVVRSPQLGPREQTLLWKRALGEHGKALNGQVETIAQQFDLDADSIERLGGLLTSRAVTSNETITSDQLWSSCREHASQSLQGKATRIEAIHGWDDLVLPEDSMAQLREIEGQVRARAVVFEGWGFGAKLSGGRGTAVMFVGPSGTGKTLAAEVLAHELRLDLLRIDLAGVIDKYIGETEKNLRRVFEVARASGAILFFDEADALFSARTDVKTSHDRYANVEVNYLLQQMEDYRGIAILATNRRQSIDRAFLRRLRFIVDFPHPDSTLRRKIWERSFPPDAPLEGLDFDALARLDVAGGSIRTIALNSALAAAHAGDSVGMPHVLSAAKREYVKLDKIISQAEFGVQVPR